MKKLAWLVLAVGFGLFGVGITMGMAHMPDAALYAFGGCLVILIGVMLMAGAQPDRTNIATRRIVAEKRFHECMEAHINNFNARR